MRNWVYQGAVKVALAYCLLQELVFLFIFALPRGDNWQQGDWLINDWLVPVRRGAFGTWLIKLSDFVNVNIIHTTIAVQVVLLVVLLVCIDRAFRVRTQQLAHYLLLASPGFVPLLWGNDTRAGLRKEMIAYIALMLLVVALRKNSKGTYSVAAVVLAISFYGNEACVLFLPVFLVTPIACGWHPLRDRAYLVIAVLLAITAVHATLLAIAYAQVGDPSLICAPLLARGADASLCAGAIEFLAKDMTANLQVVSDHVWRNRSLWFVGPSYALSMAAVLYVASLCDRPARIVALSLAAGLPFLPLFVIAVDWGRWVAMHVVSATVLLVAGIATGRIRLVRTVNPVVAAILLLSGWLVAPEHTMEKVVKGGIIFRVRESASALLSAMPGDNVEWDSRRL